MKHRAVLALARSGATDEAARRFADYGLEDASDEDIAALRARIAKDRALLEDGELRRRRAAHAAELYAAVHARTGGYYPAVNAATLWLLAGDTERSRDVAVRLRYAGVDHERVDDEAAALRAAGTHGPVEVLANYTAFQTYRRVVGDG